MMGEACSRSLAFGVLKHASAKCKYGCGDVAGIISRKSMMRWNTIEDVWTGWVYQPMSMPYSSSSLRLWFDQYC
jgi:hypothetical protein